MGQLAGYPRGNADGRVEQIEPVHPLGRLPGQVHRDDRPEGLADDGCPLDPVSVHCRQDVGCMLLQGPRRLLHRPTVTTQIRCEYLVVNEVLPRECAPATSMPLQTVQRDHGAAVDRTEPMHVQCHAGIVGVRIIARRSSG